jgi:hypothetical protein
MKQLTIRLYNSKRTPVHIQVRPGTKISDVLAYLELYDYFLIPAAAEASVEDLTREIFKDFKHGHGAVDLYARVENGDELIAFPAYEAARIAYADMMSKASPKETIQ